MAKKIKEKADIKLSQTQKQLQSKLKQSQSQKQSVNVNINLAKPKRKNKKKVIPTPKKIITAQIPMNFQPYPNYNPSYNPNNPFNAPQPSQKKYAVYPESETAPLSGILSTVPVPLKFEGETVDLQQKIKEPAKITEPLILPLEKAEDEIVLPVENPLLTPAEEESYKKLTAQYRSAELPAEFFGNPPVFIGSAEELAGAKIAKLGKKFRQKKAKKQYPEEPPSPTYSDITLASSASPFPSEIGIPTRPSILPPLNLQPRQPLFGAEEILNPEFVFTEGDTGRLSVFSAPLRQTTLPDFGIGQPIVETKEQFAETPKRGRPKGSKSKLKVDRDQPQFAQPISEIFAEPVQTNTGLLGLSIAEQPNITFLGGTQKTFIPESEQPPPAISGGLERKRSESAIPPKEEDIISSPFIFTQRSQSTL